MKQLSLLIVCFLYTTLCAAQDVIMRQNGTTSVPYYTNTTTNDAALRQAITDATVGDTIYLPGRTFNLGTTVLIINKRLNIIGVGHYPSASNATTPTIIEGAITLTAGTTGGASGGSLTGIYIKPINNDYFRVGNTASNQNLTNYSFTRCRIDNYLELGYAYNTPPLANNIYFRECILPSIGGNYATNVSFDYCINGFMYDFPSTTIANNCIISNSVSYNSGVQISSTPMMRDCAINFNNSIISSHYIGGSNIYNNCVVNGGSAGTINGANNSVLSVNSNDIFVSVEPSTYGYGVDFYYTNNYHINTNTNHAIINGVEVGIYGGNVPYKEKAIPFNPQIKNFTITGNTVTVEAKAESH